MKTNQLVRKQIKNRIETLAAISTSNPISGWLMAIRKALGMNLRQVSEKMGITPQSLRDLENREKLGTITLNRLRETGQSMNMKLVYGFVPEDKSIQQMIEEGQLNWHVRW